MNSLVLATCSFIVFDYVTGIAKGCYNKNISSGKFREGIFHKAAYVFLITFCMMCDYTDDVSLLITLPFKFTPPACAAIIVGEGASILENISVLNPDLRNSKIMKIFDCIKNEEDTLEVDNNA